MYIHARLLLRVVCADTHYAGQYKPQLAVSKLVSTTYIAMQFLHHSRAGYSYETKPPIANSPLRNRDKIEETSLQRTIFKVPNDNSSTIASFPVDVYKVWQQGYSTKDITSTVTMSVQ